MEHSSKKSLSSRAGRSHSDASSLNQRSDPEEEALSSKGSSSIEQSSRTGESQASAKSLSRLSDHKDEAISYKGPSVTHSGKRSADNRDEESYKSERNSPTMPRDNSIKRFDIPDPSSIPKFPKGKEQTDNLPRNCSYETERLDWKKVYSQSGGQKRELVLLKDERCEIDFTYTRGNVETTDDITVSDTDIISHGLNIMLKSQDDSMQDIKLPNLSKVLNLMQLTTEELAAIQAWLDQKYELGLKYEKETKALLAFVKKILAEVKTLRKTINVYRRKIQRLESELALHPSAKVLADLYQEAKRLRKEILKLDKRHGAIIRSKAELQRCLEIEFESSHKTENSVYFQIQNLKYENKTLHHLVEVFTDEAREASNNLLKRLEASLKTIKKLNGFLLRARALLEKKNVQTEEVELHLEDQDRLMKDIVDSIDLIQEHISNLRSDVDNMQKKSGALTSHAVNVRNEIKELLGNFNSISSEFTNESELEAAKRSNMAQVKEIFDSLDTQKKNVKKLEKDIAKLEKHIQSSEIKGHKDDVDIVDSSERENANEQQFWGDKMIRIRSYFEEMHEIIVSIRREEAEKRTAIEEANKKATVGEALLNSAEETIELSGRFICSDAKSGEVVTRSGVCNIIETTLPKERHINNPEYARGVKSAYSVGLQDLASVPESPKSQLHGIYAKYKLKDAVQRSAPK